MWFQKKQSNPSEQLQAEIDTHTKKLQQVSNAVAVANDIMRTLLKEKQLIQSDIEILNNRKASNTDVAEKLEKKNKQLSGLESVYQEAKNTYDTAVKYFYEFNISIETLKKTAANLRLELDLAKANVVSADFKTSMHVPGSAVVDNTEKLKDEIRKTNAQANASRILTEDDV